MNLKVNVKEYFKTKSAIFLLNLTNEPLVACYGLLPFILRKELHVTAFELSMFVMLKPLIISFSFFWGMSLKYKKNPDLLKNSVIAWLLARIPFLLFPFFNNFYYIFFASCFYLIFHKAGMPAWNEIIKRNIKNEKEINSLFSKIPILIFIESALLGIFMGKFLNRQDANWRILFFSFSLFSLIGLFLKVKINVPNIESEAVYDKQNFLSPIKDIFVLLNNRKDFARFQLGFLIGGGALMLVSPALYIFLSDTLNLTYADMSNARLVIMGVGFVFSSYFWKKSLAKTSMNILMTWVLLGFCLYVLLLLLSQISLIYFYLAFFVYGIAQAGSTLLWNLSGMHFAESQNSIIFTSANLFFLGVRGIIAPLLGSLSCTWLGPTYTLFIGFVILLCGTVGVHRLNKAKISQSLEN